MSTVRRFVRPIAALALIGSMAACNSYNDSRGKGDAPIGERFEDRRDVVFMPDGYPNLAIYCDGSTAIYTHTRVAAPVVVPNSTHCDGAR